ncbi:GNAT family N-acetyltransferase [Caballeronia sp. LZ034LL]|uniref:GNAT family N-acetyltransferase n=1 Tax=Caballeronia sp. LZ034LL TaxID=3038567 RepID=UPI002855DFBB|nr:GNAT family N-acetyltransferase [Caballeronia sp. LZ034LL]MDR5836100.1 GNAT family N-acetyltransferase [Caballeronia sp. LZ034LL]
MVSFEIKPVDNDDFHRWLPLWKDYQRFYKVDIPESVTRETWARFLDPDEPMHAALATAGDRAFGLVHSLYHRSTWTKSDYCYLQDLFVAADARGGGIGRALIEYVCDAAEQRGVSRVHWLTHETNQAGMRLYDSVAERSGFIQYRKSIA